MSKIVKKLLELLSLPSVRCPCWVEDLEITGKIIKINNIHVINSKHGKHDNHDNISKTTINLTIVHV